jgi:hypothetical protein
MELIQKLQDKGRQTNALHRRRSCSPQCQTTSKLNPKPTNMLRCCVTLYTWIQHHGPGGTYQSQNYTGSGAVGDHAEAGAHTGYAVCWSSSPSRHERIGIARRKYCKPPDAFAYYLLVATGTMTTENMSSHTNSTHIRQYTLAAPLALG